MAWSACAVTDKPCRLGADPDDDLGHGSLYPVTPTVPAYPRQLLHGSLHVKYCLLISVEKIQYHRDYNAISPINCLFNCIVNNSGSV